MANAGIVDQHVQAAETCHGLRHERVDLSGIGDIGAEEGGAVAVAGDELGCRIATFDDFGRHVGDHHVGAIGSQLPGNGTANAGGCAGDDADLAAMSNRAEGNGMCSVMCALAPDRSVPCS